MRRPKFRPSVTALESRELQATAVTDLTATPAILSPPNNRYVRVTITGNVLENRRKVIPDVDFRVTDEYRRIEPSGPVKLTRLSKIAFGFKFTITLQAKRASEYPAGRHYYVLVETSDLDNGQGLTIPVLVPLNKLKPGQTTVKSTVLMKPRTKAS